MAGGLEGKWQALNEEREQLKEENQALRKRVAALEGVTPEGLVEERDALKAQLASEITVELGLDDEEQEAMDHLISAMDIIVGRWKLKANVGEMIAAVHVLQGAVQHHLLSRLNPDVWVSWWGESEPEEKGKG